MSNLRQRKSTINGKGDDSPPDLLKSSSSDDANGVVDANDSNEETNRTTALPSPSNAIVPSKLDNFLATYGSFSGSTFTADQGLKILQWSSWAISYATRKKYKNLSPSLQKLYSEVSMARYVLRFFVSYNPSRDIDRDPGQVALGTIRSLPKLQSTSCVGVCFVIIRWSMLRMLDGRCPSW